MEKDGGGQVVENPHDQNRQLQAVEAGAKWTQVESPIAVRTNKTNPSSNSQILVLDKYLFSRVSKLHDDLYKCLTKKNHHCPSLVKMERNSITEEKTWFMSPHEDNDVCLAHQAPGVWMQRGKEYHADKHGEFLIDKFGHVYKYIPYFKNKYDKSESPRIGQTQYKCLVCDDVEVRTSPVGTFEFWGKRNESNVFVMGRHLNKHKSPKEKREEILLMFPNYPNPTIRLEARTPLRSQTDNVEVLTSLPILVSSQGKFLGTLKDDLDYIYTQIPDQLGGQLKVFTCVNNKCRGTLRMFKPEEGLIKWERTRHGPVYQPVVKGVKKEFECREINTKIMIPLQSGNMDYFRNLSPTEFDEEQRTYVAESDDVHMKKYIAQGREYGTFFRCIHCTCCASLRVLVNYSHRIWERPHLRIITGGAFVPIPHTCSDDARNLGYEKLKSEKVESRILDLSDGNILLEIERSSQELPQPENGLDEFDDDNDEYNEGEVSRAGIAEPSSGSRKRRNEEPEAGPSRVRPIEEFVPLMESPEFDDSQHSEEAQKKETTESENMSLRQIVNVVDSYCNYHQKEQPNERANYWKNFISECKDLNRKNKAWCNTRRFAPGVMKTCKIPNYEETIFWNESLDTLGWVSMDGRHKIYKCKLVECNKLVMNKFVGTCTEHSTDKCFSFVSLLCSSQDTKRIFMSYVVRTYNELVPLNWSDQQAISVFRRKKQIGLNVDEIESILKVNIKLPGVEADENEKNNCMVMARGLYSAAQVAVFLTTSFRAEKFLLVREQLNVEHIGPNFKQFLHMNGFDYQLMSENEYKKYVHEKHGTDEITASVNFRRMIKLARRDVHDEKRRENRKNALCRLCYKKNCKVGMHWWHIYFAKFAKDLKAALEVRSKKPEEELKPEDIYVGLAPGGSTSVLATCHSNLQTDTTRLGKYMLEHGYLSINELHERDYGYLFAKESEAECRVGEGLALFGMVLLAADKIDVVGLINKFLPIFRSFTLDDLLDLRTLLLARFELLFYAQIANLKEGESYLVLDDTELVQEGEEDEKDEEEEED